MNGTSSNREFMHDNDLFQASKLSRECVDPNNTIENISSIVKIKLNEGDKQYDNKAEI